MEVQGGTLVRLYLMTRPEVDALSPARACVRARG